MSDHSKRRRWFAVLAAIAILVALVLVRNLFDADDSTIAPSTAPAIDAAESHPARPASGIAISNGAASRAAEVPGTAPSDRGDETARYWVRGRLAHADGRPIGGTATICPIIDGALHSIHGSIDVPADGRIFRTFEKPAKVLFAVYPATEGGHVHHGFARMIDFAETPHVDLGTFVVDRKLMLSGRIEVLGKNPMEARLRARRAGLTDTDTFMMLRGGDGRYEWKDGRFTLADIDAPTDAEGRFAVYGIGEETLDIWPELPMEGALHAQMDLGESCKTTRTLPALDLHLTLGGARLDIEVHDEASHALIVGATIGVKASIEERFGPLPAACLDVLVPARRPITLNAAHPDYEDAAVTVEGGDPGSVKLVLVRMKHKPTGATLVVEIVNEGVESAPRLSLTMVRIDGGEPRRVRASADIDSFQDETPTNVKNDGKGRFTFSQLHLPKGRYECRVRPNRLPMGFWPTPLYFLDGTFTIDLPESGTVTQSIRLDLGGRFHVAFKGERSKGKDVRITITGPMDELPQMMLNGGHAECGATLADGTNVSWSEYSVEPNVPVPPGAYIARLFFGEREVASESFRVAMGEYTTVELTAPE